MLLIGRDNRVMNTYDNYYMFEKKSVQLNQSGIEKIHEMLEETLSNWDGIFKINTSNTREFGYGMTGDLIHLSFVTEILGGTIFIKALRTPVKGDNLRQENYLQQITVLILTKNKVRLNVHDGFAENSLFHYIFSVILTFGQFFKIETEIKFITHEMPVLKAPQIDPDTKEIVKGLLIKEVKTRQEIKREMEEAKQMIENDVSREQVVANRLQDFIIGNNIEYTDIRKLILLHMQGQDDWKNEHPQKEIDQITTRSVKTFIMPMLKTINLYEDSDTVYKINKSYAPEIIFIELNTDMNFITKPHVSIGNGGTFSANVLVKIPLITYDVYTRLNKNLQLEIHEILNEICDENSELYKKFSEKDRTSFHRLIDELYTENVLFKKDVLENNNNTDLYDFFFNNSVLVKKINPRIRYQSSFAVPNINLRPHVTLRQNDIIQFTFPFPNNDRIRKIQYGYGNFCQGDINESKQTGFSLVKEEYEDRLEKWNLGSAYCQLKDIGKEIETKFKTEYCNYYSGKLLSDIILKTLIPETLLTESIEYLVYAPIYEEVVSLNEFPRLVQSNQDEKWDEEQW